MIHHGPTRWWGRRSGFDEDALAGALLGGLDDGVELTVGNLGETVGTLRVALGRRVDLVALFDVGQTVVEKSEDVRCDFLAQTVAGAEILIDPDLHSSRALLVSTGPGALVGKCCVRHSRTCSDELYTEGSAVARSAGAV